MNITAVRTRYQHIRDRWRQDSTGRRAALVGELHLLTRQLPDPETVDTTDSAEVATLRADIQDLIAEITADQAPRPPTGSG